MIYEETCPCHGYRYISMPRQPGEWEGDTYWIAKCPLSSCMRGLLHPTPDPIFNDTSLSLSTFPRREDIDAFTKET